MQSWRTKLIEAAGGIPGPLRPLCIATPAVFLPTGGVRMERWRNVVGLEGRFKVSDLGRVRGLTRTIVDRKGRYKGYRTRIQKGCLFRPGISKLGYPVVVLDGKTRYVHLLIADAFMSPRPSGMEINHKNGKKWDSKLLNLEWVTHKENMQHSIDTGLRKVFANGTKIRRRNPNAIF